MRYCCWLLLFVITHAHAIESCEMGEDEHLGGAELFASDLDQVSELSSCFVDWNTVKQSTLNYQWIDIRPEQVFNTAHVNASINLPSHRIKTKSYLKKRPLLIVDHGASYRRLGRLCIELKSAGFETVNILKGGINAALAGGRAAHGDINDKALMMVSPKIAMEEFYLSGARFVAFDENHQQRLINKQIPVELIQSGLHTGNALGDIQSIHSELPKNSLWGKTIVLVDAPSRYYDQAMTQTQLAGHVYFLEGGVESLLTFLNTSTWAKFKRNSLPERFACKM